MLSKAMQKALNAHLKEEMYSFYLYLAMSAYLEQRNFKGLAKWMRVQAEEEKSHAMRFFDYLNDRNAAITLLAIEQPTSAWASIEGAFEAALAHEHSITKKIGALMDKAVAEKDHATVNFLQWFVKEQVEEEATLEPIVKRLADIGDHLGGIYYLDHQLGKRGAS
ncbi:MAG: ferritin [Thermoanaerobaculales bacterium]